MKKALGLLLFSAAPLLAAVPHRITYQGRLVRSGISAAGPRAIRACLNPSAGIPYCQDFNPVLPASGDFTLVIDVPPSIDFVNATVLLQLTVDGQPLSPADNFTSVPYALTASSALALASPLPASRVGLDGISAFLSSWQASADPSMIDAAAIRGPFPSLSLQGGVEMNNNKVSGLAPAADADDAVRYDQVSGLGLPTGTILPFGGIAAPPGFLLCDGAAVNRIQYGSLFAVIGSIWGAGNGTTTFNLPDLRGRALFGAASAGTFGTLGATGGSETHAHTQAAHSHTVNSHTHPISSDGLHSHSFQNGGTYELFDQSDGGSVEWGTTEGGSHNHGGSTGNASPGTSSQTPTINSSTNVPPFAVVNYIIKY